MQMITPVALSTIDYQYYIVFTVIGITFPISVYFFYPETMGQSLENLEDLFQRDLSVFQTVRMANKLSRFPQQVEPVDEKAQVGHIEDARIDALK